MPAQRSSSSMWLMLLVCCMSLRVEAQAVPEPTAATPAAQAAGSNDSAEGAPTDATPGASTSADAAPADAAPRVVLVYTQAIGVDPVVSRFVNEQLATSVAGLGYHVVQGEETARFAQRVTLPYPPAPADLWRLTYAASAQRGVFARVWAEAGQYVTEVLVASLDGAGPFVQRASSGAAELQDTVHRLLIQTMPPPNAQITAPPPGAAPATPSAVDDDSVLLAPSAPVSPIAPLPELPQTSLRPPVDRRWIVAVQTEGAIGAGGDYFYNHLLGARVDYRFSHELSGGVYFGYANLRGRNKRVSNALMYLQVENRIPITPDGPFTIPLRLGVGYLPRNGPVLRLASGLFYAVSPRMRIGAEVLVPTFWVIRDRVLFSMDLAVELGFTL